MFFSISESTLTAATGTRVPAKETQSCEPLPSPSSLLPTARHTWAEDAADTSVIEKLVVLGRNNATHDHQHVLAAKSLELRLPSPRAREISKRLNRFETLHSAYLELRDQRLVTGRLRAHADNVHVGIYRHPRHFAGRLSLTCKLARIEEKSNDRSPGRAGQHQRRNQDPQTTTQSPWRRGHGHPGPSAATFRRCE
jgi:hypothetical protein